MQIGNVKISATNVPVAEDAIFLMNRFVFVCVSIIVVDSGVGIGIDIDNLIKLDKVLN